MTRPVIISCALAGGGNSMGIHRHLSITPEQIASELLGAHRVGAAIVNIHIPNSLTGEPTRIGWPKTG